MRILEFILRDLLLNKDLIYSIMQYHKKITLTTVIKWIGEGKNRFSLAMWFVVEASVVEMRMEKSEMIWSFKHAFYFIYLF